MRLKIIISYNGALFEGSQQQSRTPNTVLGTIIEALLRLNITNKPVASGRTDSGVHATAQVLHLDLPSFWIDVEKFRRSMEFLLPRSISIRHIEVVKSDFHARYSAKSRCYRYLLSEANPNPFEDRLITFTGKLDAVLLDEAAALFRGEHDFVYLSKSGSEVHSTARVIYNTRVYSYKRYTVLNFEANGFLRSQVRLMAALLLALNEKRVNIEQFKEQIDAKACYIKEPAPPDGLYLTQVKYLT